MSRDEACVLRAKMDVGVDDAPSCPKELDEIVREAKAEPG